MASFITVNIGTHFIFNWKIEKSKYFATMVGSSAIEHSRLSALSSIKSSTYLHRLFMTSSVSTETLSKSKPDLLPMKKNCDGMSNESRGKNKYLTLSKQRSSLKGMNNRVGEEPQFENPPIPNQNIFKRSSSGQSMITAPRTASLNNSYTVRTSRSESFDETQETEYCSYDGGDDVAMVSSPYENKRPIHKGVGNRSMLVPLQEESSIIVCESEKI